MEVPLSRSRIPVWSSFSLLRRLILLLCFLSLTPLSFTNSLPSTLTSGGNETDQLALLAFKDGITPDPLGTLRSWNDSLHFCEWGGVTCDRPHGRVAILNLTSQGLSGFISPFIGNLTFLRILLLENNNFYGEIPQEIGRLSQLQDLSLRNNSLGGEIPVNVSRCFNLMNLSFSVNKLVGKIPMELGSLSKLMRLGISNNNLSGGIPPSLGNLSSLYSLFLLENSLEGSIPNALGQLTNLKFLSIGTNKLSGSVPPLLYNLSSINILSLEENQLYGSLPSDIGLTLPNLQRLHIGYNQFTGSIPVSLSNASGLERIDINVNNFTGQVPINLGALQLLSWLLVGFNNLGSGGEANDLNFFNSLTNCSNLEMLIMGENHFGGMLPNSIANLSTKLTILSLGRNNQIFGSIPPGIQNLVNLTLLDMEQNLFTGTIPIAIGKLQNLQKIHLARNKLSGQIPSSLGNITHLNWLSLEKNELQGSIPSSLEKCKYLLFLDLSQNNLNGTIPEQVIGLPSLSISLNLSHNSFTGSVPLEVGSLKNLGVLDISDNKLSGEIPNALGDCLSLERLHMEGNFFQGNIPLSLQTLRGLRDLDLSGNNLSGLIPKYLETISSLENLNLSFNHLEGEVPKGGVFRNASAISIIGNHKLCGGIPELRLNVCSIQETKNQGQFLSFKFIITIPIVVVCLTLLSSFLFLHWRRKSRKKSLSTSFLGDWYLRVSYKELLKATGGFASANLIGVGSFGSVYKGILHQDETPVAVKVLNLRQRGAFKSFMAECKALRKIRHRNLLKIITACSSADFQGNDFKALVYKFMPNGSLENWLQPSVDGQQQSRNLSFGQRLNIAIDVASALDYLHHHCQTPIVHCDLKPSNVLLDEDLTANVGDFGLSKFLSKVSRNFSEDQTSSFVIKGSIGYVAPEYGIGNEVSTQGDVYSYGILLLEMLTGKRPTDDMFKDGLSLHNFSKKALPEHVMEIVDSRLLLEEGYDEAINNMGNWRDSIRGQMWECFASVARIGVACSMESPDDRMDINDVVMELHAIKDVFLGVGNHGERTKAAVV